jgi:hypothetical protein
MDLAAVDWGGIKYLRRDMRIVAANWQRNRAMRARLWEQGRGATDVAVGLHKHSGFVLLFRRMEGHGHTPGVLDFCGRKRNPIWL